MGYMIAAYAVGVGSILAYAIYLARERRRLRGLLGESEGFREP